MQWALMSSLINDIETDTGRDEQERSCPLWNRIDIFSLF